jgi:predicted RNA-binding Zn-ribbon protein involved in translation (DUF1610 family)
VRLLSKRDFSGRATFYDVGLGACGNTNVASDYIVALNTPQYGSSYPSPNCGKSITISYNGKTAVATIQDQCPGCGYGDLDLSRGLFDHFASEDLGTFQMTWWYNDGSSDSTTTSQTPTSTYVAPTTSSNTPTTTTSTTPTSTYVAPTTSSSTVPASSSNDGSSIVSISTSASSTVASATASLIPDTVIQTNGTSIDGNSTTTSNTPQPTYADPSYGNLVLFNQAVIYMGNIVVVGAGGA